MNKHFTGCSKCVNTLSGRKEEREWMMESGPFYGLQVYTCYECTDIFCDQCEFDAGLVGFCCNCEKQFCEDCVTKICGYCNKAACNEWLCDGCNDYLCEDCIPVETCTFCNQTRCVECLPHNYCEGRDCSKTNCMECADENNVQWCECCQKEFCPDCRPRGI